ncbi:MAG: lysophospholipid acyltransferase family protein [Spirochaetota bacterium]|nr:MAG: lysophospholipid acyltransferase family protein [Spirochaetota bacterium]
MFLVKFLAVIFACIPDSFVMLLARILSPLILNAAKKEKWGLLFFRIIPKVFPEKDGQWHSMVIKKNAVHLMKFGGEMLQARYKKPFWGLPKCYIKEGKENFESLLNSDEGFIIMTCHLGNWEYAAGWLSVKYSRRLYAPVFVEESEGNRALNWLRGGRDVVILETSYNPRVSARTLLKMINLLKNGQIIYLVADQQALGGDYKGMFFGKELGIFGGPFILGQKTGKPILPLYNFRDEKNKIALCFEEQFVLNGENLDEDISIVMDFFERNIRKHPDQYIWSQDRWQ